LENKRFLKVWFRKDQQKRRKRRRADWCRNVLGIGWGYKTTEVKTIKPNKNFIY